MILYIAIFGDATALPSNPSWEDHNGISMLLLYFVKFAIIFNPGIHQSFHFILFKYTNINL